MSYLYTYNRWDAKGWPRDYSLKSPRKLYFTGPPFVQHHSSPKPWSTLLSVANFPKRCRSDVSKPLNKSTILVKWRNRTSLSSFSISFNSVALSLLGNILSGALTARYACCLFSLPNASLDDSGAFEWTITCCNAQKRHRVKDRPTQHNTKFNIWYTRPNSRHTVWEFDHRKVTDNAFPGCLHQRIPIEC